MTGEIRIGLVGCVKGKRSVPAPAQDLYTSTLFTGRRAWVERTCDRWYILSALHGLVAPEAVLEPYDEALKGASARTRRAWSQRVLAQLDAVEPDLAERVFEMHAGTDYRDFGLVEGLRSRGAEVENPTQGLSQGQQLAFYGRSSSGQVPSPTPSAAGAEHRRQLPTTSGAARVTRSGKYAPLAELLSAQTEAEITMTFGDIEEVMGRPLPASARRHRPWWANHPSHSQALAWLGVGLQVAAIDMAAEHVTFRRKP